MSRFIEGGGGLQYFLQSLQEEEKAGLDVHFILLAAVVPRARLRIAPLRTCPCHNKMLD